jgi:hypothetical protein
MTNKRKPPLWGLFVVYRILRNNRRTPTEIASRRRKVRIILVIIVIVTTIVFLWASTTMNLVYDLRESIQHLVDEPPHYKGPTHYDQGPSDNGFRGYLDHEVVGVKDENDDTPSAKANDKVVLE